MYGKSLLWQPEVAFVYLAVTEQYPDCIDAVEASAGAIQNLTACNWKVCTGYLCISLCVCSSAEGGREVITFFG